MQLEFPEEAVDELAERVANLALIKIKERLPENNGWVNQTNARKFIGVSKGTFSKWEKEGKIPFSNFEGIKRYSKKDLDEVLRKYKNVRKVD
ncbi:DNA-binding protein [Lactobacillus sp. ESL0236]|uniref:helix-turn-helix domain-containing protein n=1 Tax=unclassified Lactobacillus TaxID=2620435 RepID=UPI000EFA854C|nr:MULTISPECIES: helix-turn-helix domain-containing protein [unclassified Lactobacillus]RMC38147.1 DNA-binding protein [Lactobacillus sp. ESL0237]RMC42448.1 DNA-binding protein [Lactobacillus sp. ESL0234]RMC42614.1 DNA-binding protein [Lactobacillus sp. ESL0236]